MYCQYNDEEIIAKYLDLTKVGKYVDIGAGWARDISNTYFLYLNGWKGLCIDPYNKRLAEGSDWDKYRPNDIFLPIAIANYDGELEMHYGATVGSWLGDKYKFDEQKNDKKAGYKVPCLTIKSLIAKYPEFQEPDFMNIDVETFEKQVLEGTDFTSFKPKLLAVEHKVREMNNTKNWEHLILPFYDFKESNQLNNFYLRKAK